jgi:hypothetical protein
MTPFYDMQGIDGTIALLQELNSNNTINEILTATIQTIQLEAGIRKNVFEDTAPLDYVSRSWLMSIQDFLHHMKAEIRGIPIQTTPRHREHDQHITEMAINSYHGFTTKELQQIQACRVHMQVTVISEINDATAEQIRDEYLYDNKERIASNWQWPRQHSPGRAAWHTWRRFLRTTLTIESYRLHQPLGRWRTVPHRRYHHLYDHTRKKLLIKSQERWDAHELTRSRRRTLEFNAQRQSTSSTKPHDAVPVDIIHINGSIIITMLP